MMKNIGKIMLVSAVALSLGACAEVVDEGNVGLSRTFGEMSQEALPPGFHWYNPLTSSIEEVNVQTQRMSDTTIITTSDQQRATVHYTLNYALSAEAAPAVYSTVGGNWVDTLIPPLLVGQIKETATQYSAVNIVKTWGPVAVEITDKLRPALAAENIRLVNFEITDIKFSKEYNEAIEQKEIADLEAQRAVNVTVRKQEEAKQTVIAANARAEAIRVEAEALRSNSGLTAYRAIEKWNGVLCPKESTCIYGDGAVPFVDVGGR